MNKKTFVYFIVPGPKYNIENNFRQKLELFSQDYHGCLITTGPKSVIKTYGRFKAFCVKDIKNGTLSTFFKLFLGLLLRIKESGYKKEDDLIIISYDPLKTGVVGYFLSLIFKARFIVEINGDYGNDAIYMGESSSIKSKFKKYVSRRVRGFVLKKAHGIKALYADQVSFLKDKDCAAFTTAFPNYVRADNFYNIRQDKTILFVGFPFWIKGLDVLISAFRSISDNYPDWRLKILGFYPDLTLIQKFSGDCSQIDICPPVDPDDMPNHIGTCGIFVLPSRTEAMGRVLVEAAAAGKPRIGTNVGGIPTVIENGVDGLLVEVCDVNGLARAIEWLIVHPDERKRLGDAARWSYENRLIAGNYFQSYRRFIECVVDARSRF